MMNYHLDDKKKHHFRCWCFVETWHAKVAVVVFCCGFHLNGKVISILIE
jgi:hypothetical protein